MKPPLKRFYQLVKSQPCLACGRQGPSEADHVSFFPGKVGVRRRSHKGVAAYAAIPLCQECHRDKHRHDEREWIEERIGWENLGRHLAYWMALLLDECPA